MKNPPYPPSLRSLRPLCVLVTGAALIVVALLAEVALARAGGGGRFNDGGGGGGGGGGDGGGFILYVLIQLVFRYPIIGVPLLILFIVFSVAGSKKAKHGHESSVIRRGLDADASLHDRDTKSTLRKLDPSFDEARLLQRIERSFLVLQKAWCAHDLEPIRPFVSDGLYERFVLQLAEQKRLGYRDRMVALNVERCWFVETRVEGPFEVVTIRVRASASDYRVDVVTGKAIEGVPVASPFVEYWSFVRRKGSRSVKGDGLLEGHCPNCAAPLRRTQWSRCEHCDALLRSGEHDWVLTEITQASQWQQRDYSPPPGVARLASRDHGFGLQHLEDRASLLFWRWRTALFEGETRHLGGGFTDNARAAIAADLADDTDAGGVRRFTGECAVGHVTVAGVVSEDGTDHALVEVVWSGTTLEVRPDGSIERAAARPARCTLFVLVRSVEAQSRLGEALSSAHCPGCGAPEAEGDAGTCSFCGAKTSAANEGWTADLLLNALSEAGRGWRARLRGEDAEAAPDPIPVTPRKDIVKAEVLSWMAQVAAVDGEIDAKERETLDELARKVGTRAGDFERMLRSSDARIDAARLGPRDAKEARLWLAAGARTALADGQVSKAERLLLERLVAPYGLLPADVTLVVNEERRALFRRAKEALRRQRRGR